MNKIYLDNSVVNRTKIESPGEMKKSIFREEYDKAEIQIKDIIKLQKSYTEKNQIMKNNNCKKCNDNDDNDISNNIIAFVGERGSGKSSAMLSFKGKMLIEGVNVKINEEDNSINFHAIDNIDPSIMNKNESIIEIIVGQMFKNYKNVCKEKHSLYERHLVNCFEKVFSDLKLLNDSYKYSEMGDDLENLINISSAVSLHNNFRELVEHYLKYIDEKESENSNYLLISIDDLDLNISAAQLMMEDIRKFLIQDNIIILMAIKLEQLEEVLIQKNVSDLKVYEENYICKLDNNEVKDKFLNDIRNKAIKYLEKILPYNKRIILPKVDVDNIEMEFKDKFIDLDVYKKETENKSLKETIINIYFKKYRYIIGNDIHLKQIMPSNLRGWIELFDFLSKKELENNEKQTDKDETNNEDFLKNIQNLKNYYSSHINKEVESIVIKNNLLEFLNCSIEELNKKIFVFINNNIKEFTNMVGTEGVIRDFLAIQDVNEFHKYKRFILKGNISLGNVISWIKLYENYIDSSEEVKIIEIIKLILALRYLEKYIAEGKYNLATVIGRDFCGTYFELVRNKHVGINNKKISFDRFYNEICRIGRKKDYVVFEKELINKLKIDKQFLREEDKLYVLKGTKIESILEDIEENETDDINKTDLEEINKLNPLLNMYFNILEPQFQDQWKTRNSIFYRNEFSLNDGWITKYEWKKYWFKPLNIIGNQYLPYDKGEDKEKSKNKNYIEPILLVINVNYFMEILQDFNTNINKKRPNNTPIEFLYKVIEVYNSTIKSKKDNFLKMIESNCKNELMDSAEIKLSIYDSTEDGNVFEKISKDEIDIFLRRNITHGKYEIVGGYSLTYNDEDKFFLFYNYNQLEKIKEEIEDCLKILQDILEEDKELFFIKNIWDKTKIQLEIILKRIEDELSDKIKNKYKLLVGNIKEFKLVFNLDKMLNQHDVEEIVKSLLFRVEKVMEHIDNVSSLQED